MRSGPVLALFFALASACASLTRPDPAAQIESALADLRTAGFVFEPDVRVRRDPLASCEQLACGELVLEHERRTILLAPDAFSSPAMLRASLLDIWERHREPQALTWRELARGALRIVSDGPRAGVDDVQLLRRAHHIYRQNWTELKPEEQRGLPDPDTIPFP